MTRLQKGIGFERVAGFFGGLDTECRLRDELEAERTQELGELADLARVASGENDPHRRL